MHWTPPEARNLWEFIVWNGWWSLWFPACCKKDSPVVKSEHMLRISPKHYLVQLFCLFCLIEYLRFANLLLATQNKSRDIDMCLYFNFQFHHGGHFLEMKSLLAWNALCASSNRCDQAGPYGFWNANVEKKHVQNESREYLLMNESKHGYCVMIRCLVARIPYNIFVFVSLHNLAGTFVTICTCCETIRPHACTRMQFGKKWHAWKQPSSSEQGKPWQNLGAHLLKKNLCSVVFLLTTKKNKKYSQSMESAAAPYVAIFSPMKHAAPRNSKAPRKTYCEHYHHESSALIKLITFWSKRTRAKWYIVFSRSGRTTTARSNRSLAFARSPLE